MTSLADDAAPEPLGALAHARAAAAGRGDASCERRFAAGQYVCRKGEPVEHWIGIVEGLVKMASLSPSGKLTTFTGLPAGAWFGEGSLLKDEPRRYDVIALRASRVALMPRATFNALLDEQHRRSTASCCCS